jgi:ABC-type hemin transport system substrate-binding protein
LQQQSPEQIIVNLQQLLGAAIYSQRTAEAVAQQLAAQLSEAQAELASLKEKPPKPRRKSAEPQ